MSYIERKAAEDAVSSHWLDSSRTLEAIRSIPAADVAPVRHGKIVETIENGRAKRVFTCCGEDFTQLTQWYMPPYCPNCGTKMDLEDKP